MTRRERKTLNLLILYVFNENLTPRFFALLLDRDPNEPRGQVAADYGTVKEKSRYRSIVWETYETQTQQYLSISK